MMYGDYQISKFWSKVDIREDHECWNWIGSRRKNQYGNFSVFWKGRWYMKGAHRVSWEIANGPIPVCKDHYKTLCVCHHCDNPSCVNPKHLFLGTQNDNVQDRHKKGRSAHNFGTKNGSSKISEKTIIKIRNLYSKGLSKTTLAKKFGVTLGHIGRIVSRKLWKHI